MDYTKFISNGASCIPPSGIRKFFDIVAEMKDAISLGVGEPDYVTPDSIREAAVDSINKGITQYTSNSGLKELREEIAVYLKERYSVEYQPLSEILVTVGASEAIDLTLRAILNPGDEVLVPDPSYVSYAPCVTLCGGKPVSVYTCEQYEFKILPSEIEKVITPKTKAIILPFPNNPTGGIMEKDKLEAIAEVIKKHDLLVISDEIYAELTYGDRHVSIASLPGMWERTVLINGFSKAFAMTGWRVGYVACPKELFKPILKIHQYAIMCAPTCSQYAALEALVSGRNNDYLTVRAMRDDYDGRRKFMVNALREAGLTCFEPKGAFYLFPSVGHLGVTGEEFAEGLLKAKKVAVVPGSAFGESGKYHVRCCYATSMEKLKIATKKIAEYVEELKNK